MPIPARHLVIRFWLQWTFAHALCVSTFCWLAFIVADAVPLSILWLALIVVFLGFGVLSLLQQLMLWSIGVNAILWWLTSYLAWLAGSVGGWLAEELKSWVSARLDVAIGDEVSFIMASLAFGIFFGLVQMLAWKRLRQQVINWPLVNTCAFGSAVTVGILVPLRVFNVETDRFSTYLMMFAAGGVYGAITALGALLASAQAESKT